jgi:hypothetical protein
MSGIPTIPLAIAALYVKNDTLKLLYGCMALICGLLASFIVWLKERQRYETEAASHSLRKEWKNLQDNFGQYPPLFHAVCLLKSTMPTKRERQIAGADDHMKRENFCVLLEEAGNFLCRAEWIVKSYRGINDPDPVSRWLNFICEMREGLLESHGSGHVKGIAFESSHITGLAQECSLMCAQLAAKEICLIQKGNHFLDRRCCAIIRNFRRKIWSST